jgi:predicted nucleic acid-binding protein
MIAVADAGPVHYLALIGSIDVLQPLYSRVIVPETVSGELQHCSAPEAIRNWIVCPPDWCEIRPDESFELTPEFLDPGERASIALALSLKTDRLLIDDWEGRAEAVRQNLIVIGTLGVLAEAHREGLLDFATALMRLRQTSFYMSEALVERVRRELSTEPLY